MTDFLSIVNEQEKVKKILESIHNSRRVPHAFLFYGPEGVGKFFTSLQFAKLLYSDYGNGSNETILSKISQLQEPYIKLIMPLPRGKGESSDDSSIEKLSKEQLDNLKEEIKNKIENPFYKITIDKANTIKINSIRDIKKYLELSYSDLPYRFVIILESDLMNDQAQNALLKSLEEPPEGTVFFLITTDKDKLLSTVQSRCWPVHFEPLSNNAVKQILVNNFGIEEEIARKASLFGNGSVLHALSLAEDEFQSTLESIISFLRYSIGKKYHSAYKELNQLLDDDSENLILVINLIKNWLSDVLKERNDFDSYFFEDYKDTFTKFNQRYSDSSVEKVYHSLDLLEEYYGRNLNLNVLILNLIFELSTLTSRN